MTLIKTLQRVKLTFFVIIFLVLTIPAHAEVILSTSTEYYAVTGNNQQELIANIRKLSPIYQEGKTYSAVTQANLRYEFSWIKRGNICSMKKATVHLHITYKYPQLTGKPSASILKWWNSHLKELEEHELVHGEIAKDGAAILNEKLNSISKISCSNTKEALKKIANPILAQTKKTQINYDMLTDHGLKQSRYKKQ